MDSKKQMKKFAKFFFSLFLRIASNLELQKFFGQKISKLDTWRFNLLCL